MIGADRAADVEDAPGDHIQRQARRIAEQGAELARGVGFEAEPILASPLDPPEGWTLPTRAPIVRPADARTSSVLR